MEDSNNNLIIPDELITSKIYLVRGEKVMLDRDLAELFDMKAIRLREQVRRNIEKFPSHFMFQLSEEEVVNMVSQNAIPSKQHLGGSLPYVFTEYGVLQLANVLKSIRATQVSIKVIEVFVRMREMLTDTIRLHLDIELIKKKLENQDRNIELVFSYFYGSRNSFLRISKQVSYPPGQSLFLGPLKLRISGVWISRNLTSLDAARVASKTDISRSRKGFFSFCMNSKDFRVPPSILYSNMITVASLSLTLAAVRILQEAPGSSLTGYFRSMVPSSAFLPSGHQPPQRIW